MDFTCELSKSYSLSPFEIMKQDKDEVIMLVNYYIEKGQENNQTDLTVDNYKNDKESDKQFWSLL